MKKYIFVWVIVFFVCIIFGVFFWVMYPLKYTEHIKKYSQAFGLEPSLVASVICVESRFNTNAKSAAGACGLMQLLPSTFEWICEELNDDTNMEQIFEANTNIKCGCYYLSYLTKKYNNLIFVLTSYNAGEGVALSWGGPKSFDIENIQYAETKAYVKKVLRLKKLYDNRI